MQHVACEHKRQTVYHRWVMCPCVWSQNAPNPTDTGGMYKSKTTHCRIYKQRIINGASIRNKQNRRYVSNNTTNISLPKITIALAYEGIAIKNTSWRIMKIMNLIETWTASFSISLIANRSTDILTYVI